MNSRGSLRSKIYIIEEKIIKDNRPFPIKEEREGDELHVEPKVMEPYEPIGDNVPRKVAISRKQKEYASF